MRRGEDGRGDQRGGAAQPRIVLRRDGDDLDVGAAVGASDRDLRAWRSVDSMRSHAEMISPPR